ncbi:MAG: histidine phosphatase family protein [Anaerolineae bacterium]|nr:histidine phosphatase family protein [Anaerolineae bacterium]
MELYLIRHGQSTNNVTMLRDPLHREADPPLTELGQRQAEALAGRLAHTWNVDNYLFQHPDSRENLTGEGITRLLVSPMKRALQTALPISRELGLHPEVHLDIFEHGGLYLEGESGVTTYPGLTRAEMHAQFPGYQLPPGMTESGWWHATDREDLAACQGRAIRMAEHLKEIRFSAQRIAIVSHGMFLDHLFKALLNLLPGDGLHLTLYNTSITRIDFLPDGKLGLRYLNRFDHLALEQVS